MKYYDLLTPPLELSGLAVKEKGKFWRLPEDLIDNVNEDIKSLGKHTAGACVRFRTDSEQIELKVTLSGCVHHSHFAPSGHSGCDVYFDKQFANAIRPEKEDQTYYEGISKRPFYQSRGVRDVQINLPLYNGVNDLVIGVDDGANVLPPTPFKIKKPVVFYGSSITQGACASKPGNAYFSMLSRALDFPVYCLGFSGSAHGEKNMAEYIAGLSMSAFVMDYDHNDGMPELLGRHEPFFKIIREKNPELPIILPSRGDFERKAENRELREVVRATYNNAVAAGDKNAYFIDGETYFGKKDRGCFTVDGVHPTDLGMWAMAQTMEPILKKILYK